MAARFEVIATALNLRAAPDKGSAIVTVLKKGQAGVASGAPVQGWIPLLAGGRAGFASATFLKELEDNAAAASQQPSLAVPASAGPGVEVKHRDLSQLHPRFRAMLIALLEKLGNEGAPFRVFEAYRTPERQEWLFAQGRTRPGGKVTNAHAWQSYHQFGLGTDLVLFVNGQWSWSEERALAAHWKTLRRLAAEVGLRQLSFEMPHVELPVALSEIKSAALLADGDETWRDNLALCCERWRLAGGSGAPDLSPDERPPLGGS